jgi:Tfp pilus assembly protein PilF
MSQISFERAIEIALEQHRAGKLARAEALYMEILRQDPGNADAFHLLGVLAHQGGRPDLAEQLIERAVGKRKDAPSFHYNLGEARRVQGKLADAAASYRRAVELAPEYVEALNNLSIVLHAQRDHAGAVAVARRAVDIEPTAPAPHNNLALQRYLCSTL